LHAEFEEIRANEIVFDSSGIISEIQGTSFDFEGKAVFLKRVIEDLRLSPSDVLFVWNSCNNVFTSQSGVRTLCVMRGLQILTMRRIGRTRYVR
jgi:hypothetical protein